MSVYAAAQSFVSVWQFRNATCVQAAHVCTAVQQFLAEYSFCHAMCTILSQALAGQDQQTVLADA